MADVDLVVAKSSFFAGNRLVRAGEVWDGGDPVVKHYPAGFRPLEVQRSRPARAPRESAAEPKTQPKAETKRTFGRKS